MDSRLTELVAAGPAELLERSLDEYGSLLLEVSSSLGSEHVEALDYAIRHTVARLLARSADSEELAEAYEALRRLVPIEREDELAEWLPRWRAFADLLDARLSSLAAREPDKALGLLHAQEILDLVTREPGLTQAEIGQRLGLKAANLSRILGVLEAHEMVERRSVGREKRVHPGRLAAAGSHEQNERENQSATNSPQKVERTMLYLCGDRKNKAA